MTSRGARAASSAAGSATQAPRNPSSGASAPPADAAASASDEDELMEQQLQEHAIRVYNEFVCAFQRRASQRIAANRVMIEAHRRQQERSRRRYPETVDAIALDAAHGIRRQQKVPVAPEARVRKTARTEIRTTSESLALSRPTVVLPRVPATPNATMWTALSKNYDVEDERQLRYLPYFGDDDDEDVISEFFEIQRRGTSACEMDFTKEMCEAVLRHLQLTWELTPHDLALIAKTLHVDLKIMEDVHRQLHAGARPSKKQRTMLNSNKADAEPANGDAAPSGDDSTSETLSMEHQMQLYERTIDSYRSLFCRRCYVYDCEYHGCREVPKLDITEQNAVYEMTKCMTTAVSTGKNCGNQCFLGQTQKNAKFSKARAISTAFGWDERTRVACARAYFICAGNFCDMARLLGDKTCLDVAEFCEFHDINDHSLALTHKLQSHARRPARKKKKKITPSVSHLQQLQSGPMNVIPTVITPCAHPGACDDNNCVCHQDGRLCSKLCACIHEECKIFFAGCRCVKGRCRSRWCPCFAAGRECDLDLCVVCCAEDAAAESSTLNALVDGNRSQAQPATAVASSSSSCQNRNMSLGRHKRLRVGRSTMEGAGWGLFVDEPVAKDEFVIEYIGEMVTQEEAERRGVVYDKLNRSYLFNLDSETVIDATRKGNKTRFINHSSRPNCYSKIININSDYRIGIYAMRDIAPHTELFFDYGYDKDIKHQHIHKTPTLTEWMKKPQRS
ncbi:hypothetical protein ATCC90586_008221 [Pythium insidiosum]|nr:hypothetical protein ATCC90586_008221 [Pythium insidiosum]